MRPELLQSLDGQKVVREKSAFTQALSEWLQPSETIRHPSLYLINTRLWLDQLSKTYRRPITIDKVPDKEWYQLFEKYDYFWFMGIYTPSEASKEHAQKYSHKYRYALPDLNPQRDIVASPFAIPEYRPSRQIAGNWSEWDRMIATLHAHGKKVFLDLVLNHTAVDHPWAVAHPDYYVQGTEQQYRLNPNFYQRVVAHDGQTYYLAHGRDPNSSEWADTLQLNYANTEVQTVMEKLFLELTPHADGFRCDMAMLITAPTFIKLWGKHLSEEQRKYITANNFWGRISRSKKRDFILIAEAYWDHEGLDRYFDYIYDDTFFKRAGSPASLRPHLDYLMSPLRRAKHYQPVLYVENHDEERAADRLGVLSQPAAVLASLIPKAILMINQGQEAGYRIRPPMQIARFPKEDPVTETQRFYDDLLAIRRSKLFQQGIWRLAAISTLDPNIIALTVNTPDHTINASVCMNFGDQTARCSLPEVTITQTAGVYSLSRGIGLEADQVRHHGIYVELNPAETQIVFYSK